MSETSLPHLAYEFSLRALGQQEAVPGCVCVLMPKRDLFFALSGPVLFEREYGREGGLQETYRRLAYWIDGFWQDNQSIIDHLLFWYRLSALALAVEVALWTVHLAR